MSATDSPITRQAGEDFRVSRRTKVNPFRRLGMTEISHYCFQTDSDIILRFVDVIGQRSSLVIRAGDRFDMEIEPWRFKPWRIYMTPCRRRTVAKVKMLVVGT